MTNPSTHHRSAPRGRVRGREQIPTGVLDTAPAGAPSTRERVATIAGLNVLAGIWLIIAPFVLGYADGDPIWNDVIFGAVVLVLAGARSLFFPRQVWLSWINALVGAWVFASAFWLDSSATASWNDAILGVIVFVLALAAASELPSRRRTA
jgi:hypothetical protein